MDNKYSSLREAVSYSIDEFFTTHGEDIPESGLYHRVMDEVEAILISKTMHHAQGVQSKAAFILGINRSTLRAKLKNIGVMD